MEPKSAEQIQQVVKEARELVSMLERTSVRRVCVEAGDFKSRSSAPLVAKQASRCRHPSALLHRQPPGCCDQSPYRLGPLVGTFYRCPGRVLSPSSRSATGFSAGSRSHY